MTTLFILENEIKVYLCSPNIFCLKYLIIYIYNSNKWN